MCSSHVLRAGLVLALCSLTSSAPLAQTAPYDAFPNLWVADNTVLSIDVVGDTLYLGGDFEYVGPPTGQLAVLDKQTGEADLRLPRVGAAGAAAGIIQAVIPDGQGGYYVGGDFRFVGSEERYNLAHVLPDGTLDPDFQPDPLLDTDPFPTGSVSALALEDGVLYVGGFFDEAGGQPRDDLAAFDAATGILLPLSANFARSDNPPYVEALAVIEGVLYVGGVFTAVNGQPRVGAVALDAAMGAVLPWRADLADENPNFLAGAFDLGRGDGTLYLGGSFDFVNAQPRNGIAEVTLADPVTGEGGEPTPWAPVSGLAGFIITEEYLWGGAIVGSPLGRIGRDTGVLQIFPLSGGLRAGRSVALDPVGGPSGEGTLYLACGRLIGTRTFPVVVGADPATGEATGYEVLGAPGYLGTDYVGALAVEPGPEGRVFAGGSAVSLGGVRRPFFAALDLTTGRALPDFTAGEVIASVLDLVPSLEGRTVYFAGYAGVNGLGVLDVPTWSLRNFGEPGAAVPPLLRAQAAPANAGAASPLVHLDANSPPVQQAAPAPPPAANAAGGTPRALGGNSSLVATEDRLYYCPGGCAAFDRQTEELLWAVPAVVVTGFNVNALLLDGPGGPGGGGGTLYLSGPIEEIPLGQERAAFAALDPATGTVLDWDVGVTLGGPGSSRGGGIAWLDADGGGAGKPVLYLGGDNIYEVQGQERDDLLAVDPETAALLPWDPSAYLAAASALAMEAQRTSDGGLIYVSGAFRFVATEPGPRLLAFNAETGAPLLEWQPAVGLDVRTMVLSERYEALFLGGFFQNSLNGSGHAYLVTVTPASPILPTSGEPGGPAAPASALLSPASPNPFSGTTALTLTLPEAQRVEAVVYDVLGRRVVVLHDGPLAAGTHRLEVSGTALPAGVYVVRVRGASFTASRSFIRLR